MPIHHPDILEQGTRPHTFSYGDKDVMLYALGVGLGADPMDEAGRVVATLTGSSFCRGDGGFGDGREISFEARVKARDATVIKNGLTVLWS